ncbi:dihydrodipicolinate synthase family protein [Agromyces aerolatus]|uniref:dihydrodipicolinate synthase family protein n=1 Tax=Agromyces sp. LY-1074 TaxID=3074080 RepID=UPI00285E4C8F|nr:MULTISPECIES: dihydrodipicolinate synthase family protein [unclassified Agromyces]MDR5698943.1 dihydrodipicolinate synthase family protein [Agromyces sp. LY-1074]MDR5705279.1 dihydrodipicolinate synthase family protein [Agromyces sp. LY-1358]
MFTGLSAFPLTPVTDDRVDEEAFVRLVGRLRDAGVDSIGALGSTGSYMYLNREERARVAALAVEAAGDVPVIVGIGALRTRDAVAAAEDAHAAGAAGVLLAPVGYQKLSEDEVFGLFADVTRSLSVPLVIYDNPGTTHFTFTPELYARIAGLPHVASVKIPGVPADPDAATAHVAGLRHGLPVRFTIGVSGDAAAANGLIAGCDTWYSVIGGTLPELAIELTAAARSGDAERAGAVSDRLAPLWHLFAAHGSLRVVAAIAALLDLTAAENLPSPVRGLDAAMRDEVRGALRRVGIDA